VTRSSPWRWRGWLSLECLLTGLLNIHARAGEVKGGRARVTPPSFEPNLAPPTSRSALFYYGYRQYDGH